MKLGGLIRLWLVVATVAVGVLIFRDFNAQSRTWRAMDDASINLCTQQQINSADHPDSLKCISRMGANKTFFEHERISAGDYWLRAVAMWAAVVLAATTLLFGLLLVARWIVRGFSGLSTSTIEEWWGGTFERRGTITGDSIPAELELPTMLQRLSTADLVELYRSEGIHDHPSVRGLLAHHELRRRDSWTARAALVVSILALLVAAIIR